MSGHVLSSAGTSWDELMEAEGWESDMRQTGEDGCSPWERNGNEEQGRDF